MKWKNWMLFIRCVLRSDIWFVFHVINENNIHCCQHVSWNFVCVDVVAFSIFKHIYQEKHNNIDTKCYGDFPTHLHTNLSTYRTTTFIRTHSLHTIHIERKRDEHTSTKAHSAIKHTVEHQNEKTFSNAYMYRIAITLTPHRTRCHCISVQEWIIHYRRWKFLLVEWEWKIIYYKPSALKVLLRTSSKLKLNSFSYIKVYLNEKNSDLSC